jgi:hypothetical protein
MGNRELSQSLKKSRLARGEGEMRDMQKLDEMVAKPTQLALAFADDGEPAVGFLDLIPTFSV